MSEVKVVDVSQLLAVRWNVNYASKPNVRMPYPLKQGLNYELPTLGEGEDGGDFRCPDRFIEPKNLEMRAAMMEDGSAYFWGIPLNMPTRQIFARKQCESLAGFGGGPITIHVTWGEGYGKSDFTWRATAEGGQAWIMGEPK